MKIIITEEQKKKLFIPRRLSGENSRFIQWNKEQPIVDGVQINQYTHDGKKIGIWEEYWSNGKLWYKGSYKNGERDGIWEWYYDNGQLVSKGPYINGKRDGYWEKYFDNGNLYSKGSYKNDKKDGIWEEWFKDGDFWYEGEWDMGKYIRDIRI
jgi:antitoxin component YwqK of YwqJK toxin-antitoxin module